MGLLLVAVALAALVSLLVHRLGQSQPAEAAVPLRAVVAAARPLNAGVQIQAEDLRLVRVPPQALPEHIFTSTQQLAGRVLTSAVVPNQVLIDSMVAQPGTGVGLPPLIPPGMRAVSVKVNDVVSVAGYALPGTHVDVLLTGNPRADQSPAGVTTITLLKNVQVLTAGQRLEQQRNGKPDKVAVITLLVTPEGAEKLAMADGYGRLQLSLRNPLDDRSAQPAPLRNTSLYQVAEPAPRRSASRARPVASAPVPVWAVELISGGQQQVVKFAPTGARP